MNHPHDNAKQDAPAWETELLVVRGEDRAELRAKIADVVRFVAATPGVSLHELACALNANLAAGGWRLAVVAKSLEDLQAKLAQAAEKLADPKCEKVRDVTGVYFFAEPLYPHGKIAFLFPGEGAQYLNMAGDLLPHFPALEAVFAFCDEIAARPGMKIPSPRRFVAFPHDAAPEERQAAEQELRRLGNAMFSVLVTDLGLFHLLQEFGLAPDMIAGHSAGELAALMAAGCMSDEHDATERVVQTMQALEEMEEETGVEPAVLLAVGAPREKMTALLNEVDPVCPAKSAAQAANRKRRGDLADLGDDSHPTEDSAVAFVAMDNCPHQTVLVGQADAMSAVEARLQQAGYVYERLSLSRPYHTRLFEPYAQPLAEMLEAIPFQPPMRTIYSCTTAQPFPGDSAEIRKLTLAHWFSPVEFAQMVRNMYNDGARLFVEVGPRGNLTSFVEDILRGRSFAAIPADVQRRSGVTQLQHLLAQLAAHGVPLDLEPLYKRQSDQASLTPPAATMYPANPSHVTAGMRQEAQRPPTAAALHPGVIAGHLALMDQFLEGQQAVMEQFLGMRRGGRRPARIRRGATPPSASVYAPMEREDAAPLAKSDQGLPVHARGSLSLPLIGEVIRLEPGQEVVMRRRLDLTEDRFAADHTVGGRMVSKVHPDHHGLPIGPMTFTLELMGETAALLAPGAVVAEVKDVRLLRWLAYYEDAPGEIEITAKMLGPAAQDDLPGAREVEVRVAVLDNGDLPPGETAGPAAVGRVVLAPEHPAAPPTEPFALTAPRPCPITLDELYHDLFHGPLFTGVTELTTIGDEGLEAFAVVLPRQGLLRSTDDPPFLLDPVLLDVAMHPLCAWHLDQPDRAGRTLLPFELKSVRIYGPRPSEGARFRIRGQILEASPRHFVHRVEALDDAGRLWCRLTAKYWRFYMPHGEVNFHGRKDEYFISRPWPEVLRSGGGGERRGVCVRMEPPVDLHQPAMQMVTAKMTLSDAEMREYRTLSIPPKKRFDWVFGRLAAKDAVRLAWWERYGERFFPADLEIQHDEHGRPFAVHLGYGDQAAMPQVSITHTERMMAALASFEPWVGIDLEKIEPRETSFERLAFDEGERRLLDEQSDRPETVTRFWCAKEAVAKALGRGLTEGTQSVAVRAYDPPSGVVELEIGAALGREFPQFAGRRLRALTQRHKTFMVAATFCDIA